MATAFQGVASKIGTGIIEDPLAAFEQIMKEKERRKKERRAALESPPPRRRSRSGERRRSPDRRSPRHNSSDSRERGRSTGMQSNLNAIVRVDVENHNVSHFLNQAKMSVQLHGIETEELKNVADHPTDDDHPSTDDDADPAPIIRAHRARIRGNFVPGHISIRTNHSLQTK